MHRRYNDKLSFSNYVSLDILHITYSFGDSIFFHCSWPLNSSSLYKNFREDRQTDKQILGKT